MHLPNSIAQDYVESILHSDDKHISLICRVMCLLCVLQYLAVSFFFLLFLSMEAPQALREKKLYVALKPDQAACVL